LILSRGCRAVLVGSVGGGAAAARLFSVTSIVRAIKHNYHDRADETTGETDSIGRYFYQGDWMTPCGMANWSNFGLDLGGKSSLIWYLCMAMVHGVTLKINAAVNPSLGDTFQGTAWPRH